MMCYRIRMTDETEDGRRLASEREDLIAAGADPAELLVPLAPDPTAGERHRCVHCNLSRSGHGLSTRACLAAGYYGNYFTPAEPDTVSQPADVEALTDAERWELWENPAHATTEEAVRAIVAARLDAVRRKAGDERAEQIAQAIEVAGERFADVGRMHYATAARIARETR